MNYTKRLLPNFGSGFSGFAANLLATVYDGAGTAQLSVTAWTESGVSPGSYKSAGLTLSTDWLPGGYVEYSITGQGVGYQEQIPLPDALNAGATVRGYGDGVDPASLILAAQVDGLSLSNLLLNVLAGSSYGRVRVTENLDGTLTLDFLKSDAATVAFSRRYDPNSGVRS